MAHEAERAEGLALARKQGCVFEIMTTSFSSSAPTHRFARPEMPGWQDQIFIALPQRHRRLRLFPIPDPAVSRSATQVAV